MDQKIENKYDYKKIETKWQKKWNKAALFEAEYEEREKYYINFPFPYINGKMHLGHGYSLLKADAMARFQRMLDKNVLFPFAFHATGEPIVGAAKRVKAGDKSQIRALELSGVPSKEIHKFEDPKFIVDYFRKSWTDDVKLLGLAIDWRRQFVTTQLTPTFSKFVQWQYRKLKKDGFVVQGSHPVIWCPADQNPTGDHDRLEGEGARVVDFIVLKFYSKTHDAYFLPATLRPETIYGVTNMFIHPNAIYVIAEVNGENVIISEETVIKFQDQKFQVKNVSKIDNKELIGTFVSNPVTNTEIIVLPGDFIDSGGSTGIVMSVPAHAPMDWIILKNVKDNPENLKSFGITLEQLKDINPISLIEVEGYGEFPAGEEIDKRKILSQQDPMVKEATRTIYRKEQNHGKLLKNTGKYSGMTIVEAKDQIIEDFQNKQIAFIMKEPGDVVICRCGTRNHVKFLENQWFLKFSDIEWKNKTHQLLDEMDVFPSEARKAFHNTVDWLENKACARRSGLGTPMPWDTDWIIETLSDSVIYMAYYIISKYVNDGRFFEDYATDEVYEFIVLGNGNPKKISENVGIEELLLKEIRNELIYFYPFDLRTSGNDLMNNHLTFMLMHHTAIFPREFWPKGVAVNGHVAIDGEKMSKRHGKFEIIEDVVNIYGVDATRLGLLIAGEGLKDASFSLNEAESYVKWIQNLYELAFELSEDNIEMQIDNWLKSRVQNQIKKVRTYLSKMDTRSAFQSAYHEILQDIKWYTRRRGSKGPAYTYAIEKMVLLVCPFIPHVIEEIWSKWKRKGFASSAEYPSADESQMNKDAEYGEKFLGAFIDDIKNLRSFLIKKEDVKLERIEIFVAPIWMYPIYNEAFENGLDGLIKRVMDDPKVRQIGKSAAKYAQDLIKEGVPPDFSWNQFGELKVLNEAKSYIEFQANAPIVIVKAESSTNPKARVAIPRRPGINFIIN